MKRILECVECKDDNDLKDKFVEALKDTIESFESSRVTFNTACTIMANMSRILYHFKLIHLNDDNDYRDSLSILWSQARWILSYCFNTATKTKPFKKRLYLRNAKRFGQNYYGNTTKKNKLFKKAFGGDIIVQRKKPFKLIVLDKSNLHPTRIHQRSTNVLQAYHDEEVYDEEHYDEADDEADQDDDNIINDNDRDNEESDGEYDIWEENEQNQVHDGESMPPTNNNNLYDDDDRCEVVMSPPPPINNDLLYDDDDDDDRCDVVISTSTINDMIDDNRDEMVIQGILSLQTAEPFNPPPPKFKINEKVFVRSYEFNPNTWWSSSIVHILPAIIYQDQTYRVKFDQVAPNECEHQLTVEKDIIRLDTFHLDQAIMGEDVIIFYEKKFYLGQYQGEKRRTKL
ncbi:hypothetical protein CYY_010430 [Polysphondylium violaceum]|uniref:Uncharacterized protein n=1 Tax=Polysphondylium violaceum TaxID=133409 RepID=A0A8J4PJ78_9MYCE|nr:hypothetical protein CYY_010430 [Polysphondylium violaceum]